MAFRKMPDGSLLDLDTGVLSNYDVSREMAARDVSARSGARIPGVPTGMRTGVALAPTPGMANPNRQQQQTPIVMVPAPNGGQMPIIRPDPNLLRVNPFELGMGVMSDTTKKFVLVGLIVAGAAGAVWLNRKMSAKKAAAVTSKGK
jgi:hypothetical protein